MTPRFSGRYGPLALERGYRLRLYAPVANRVDVHIDGRVLAMEQRGAWFHVDDADARAGSRYAFAVDGGMPIPDPASRFQPDGVHAPSAIVASTFAWPDDGWRGRPWHEHVVYELHVGTFTFEGTYESAGRKLEELVALGVTAIELMPIAAFPGARNWGYDGVMLYAPYAGYGSPDDLKHFIAAAHAHGLAVLLDVVYNHFGPEGNYLHGIAPTFFNEDAHTPWGAAINVAYPDVRAFFAENAAYWLSEFRFDGLRLDATQTIVDPDTPSFLREVRETALAACDPARQIALVVENDDNDIALLDAGYDAQWNDDVHHSVHVLATGETTGYYRDYAHDPVARPRARNGLCLSGRSLGASRRHAARRRERALAAEQIHLVFAESRSDRQSCLRRTAGTPRPARRAARLRRARLSRTVAADAIHGRRVGCIDAVSLLLRFRTRSRSRGDRRAAARVRIVSPLCRCGGARHDPRSGCRRHVRSVATALGRAQRAAACGSAGLHDVRAARACGVRHAVHRRTARYGGHG
jgi:malto-oligosyltrehalose trehalohydrolase